MKITFELNDKYNILDKKSVEYFTKCLNRKIEQFAEDQIVFDKETANKVLGLKCKFIRDYTGLTQNDLANTLNTYVIKISKIENHHDLSFNSENNKLRESVNNLYSRVLSKCEKRHEDEFLARALVIADMSNNIRKVIPYDSNKIDNYISDFKLSNCSNYYR